MDRWSSYIVVSNTELLNEVLIICKKRCVVQKISLAHPSVFAFPYRVSKEPVNTRIDRAGPVVKTTFYWSIVVNTCQLKNYKYVQIRKYNMCIPEMCFLLDIKDCCYNIPVPESVYKFLYSINDWVKCMLI